MSQKYWYAYLIHLSRPLGTLKHKAQFYLGISQDWVERFTQHRKGQGAKMLAYAAHRRIDFSVVRVWRFPDFAAAHEFERWAKRSLKNHRRLLTIPAWLDLPTANKKAIES